MLESYLEVAKKAALKAGEILMEGFGTNLTIRSKSEVNDLVTEYDTKSEDAIIKIITGHFPEHSFLAEESGRKYEKDSHFKWIIDPLDGTVNYSKNLPIFSVSIGLEYKGEIIVGVIYNPILKELFYAEKGKGAYLNDNKIKVSENDDFKKAFLVTGFPYNVSENPNKCVDHFVKVIGAGIPIRRLGSAALDLAYVACGRFDGFWEVYLHPWDIAAGWLLIEEAGGKVSDYENKTYQLSAAGVIATNGKIHDNIYSMID